MVKQIFLYLILSICAGCSLTKPSIVSLNHPPENFLIQNNSQAASVGVLSWDDKRVFIKEDNLWAWLPLIPYRPRETQNSKDNMNPLHGLALQPEKEIPPLILRYMIDTKTFSNGKMISDTNNIPSDVNFIIKPTLNAWSYKEYEMHYGLSYGAVLLCCLGFPIITYSWSYDYNIDLIQADNGKTILSENYKGATDQHVHTLPFLTAWLWGHFSERMDPVGSANKEFSYEAEDVYPLIKKSMEDFTSKVKSKLSSKS